MKQIFCTSLFAVVYTNYSMLPTTLSKPFLTFRVNICPLDLKWVGDINGISEQVACRPVVLSNVCLSLCTARNGLTNELCGPWASC